MTPLVVVVSLRDRESDLRAFVLAAERGSSRSRVTCPKRQPIRAPNRGTCDPPRAVQRRPRFTALVGILWLLVFGGCDLGTRADRSAGVLELFDGLPYDEAPLRCAWPPDRSTSFGAIDLLVQGPSGCRALVLVDRGPYLRGWPIDSIPDATRVAPLPLVDRLELPTGWHRIVVHGVDADGRLLGPGETRFVRVMAESDPLGTDRAGRGADPVGPEGPRAPPLWFTPSGSR